MLSERDNLLRVVRFETPEYIPMQFHINAACWHHYPPSALEELMAVHPLLFPKFETTPESIGPQYGPGQRADEPYKDEWGCVWETTDDGITGVVTEHPLKSWDDFEAYAAEHPRRDDEQASVGSERIAAALQKAKTEGRLAQGGLRHGHTFLTLTYIRGYENLIFDMADEEPRLHDLIRLIEDDNMMVVRRYLDGGAEWMGYPEDLGMQVGPMLSPAQFRKYIKPTFERLMAPTREAGCIVHMHSDGDIRALVDDLIDGGVEVINLQDLVNGIDWIRDRLAGRICIDLDIDRQQITRFGTPTQIDGLIREAVEKLGSREGGLMTIYGLYPGVPLENVKALMDAMERYTGYYA